MGGDQTQETLQVQESLQVQETLSSVNLNPTV